MASDVLLILLADCGYAVTTHIRVSFATADNVLCVKKFHVHYAG